MLKKVTLFLLGAVLGLLLAIEHSGAVTITFDRQLSGFCIPGTTY
jgi:hypothetical protein